jgi:hybrid cluster-associated redox disulfide protein
MKIMKEMSINECLRMYPQTAKVFNKYNMGCIGCRGANAESIENGALMHGLDLNEILHELNKVIENSHHTRAMHQKSDVIV